MDKENKLIPMNLQLFAQTVMRETDTVAGNLATCYVTIKGNRYYLMQLQEFEGTPDITITDVNAMGSTLTRGRPTGMKLTWSGTIMDNTELFRDLVMEYLETGVFPPFDIQTTNEDAISSLGRHTVIYESCYLDKTTMSKITKGGELLEAPISGIANGIKTPEKYRHIEGMM